MSQCRQLDEYLDDRLDEPQRLGFEAHVGACAACQRQVAAWERAAGALRRWGEGVPPPEVTEAGAQALVRRAAARRPAVRAGRWIWVLGGTATAAAAALLLVVHGIPGTWRRAAEAPGRMPGSPVAAPHARHDGWRSLAAGSSPLRLREGRVQLALAAGSEARLRGGEAAPLELRLARGAVAADVDPHRAGPPVRILAGRFRVEVRGTRFRVSLSDAGALGVAVSRGRVGVSGPAGESQDVRAGQQLEWAPDAAPRRGALDARAAAELRLLVDDGAAAPPPPLPPGAPTPAPGPFPEPRPPAAPGARPRPAAEGASTLLAKGRKLVAEGHYAEAAPLLRAYLVHVPRDGRTWSLMADCLRKAGRHAEAVIAYEQAIRLGPPDTAERARFLAAGLLQDRLGRHAQAIALLKAYLAGGGARRPLAAEALVRQAHSAAALGRLTEARQLLERVLREHGGTTAALLARRRLQTLARPAKAHPGAPRGKVP